MAMFHDLEPAEFKRRMELYDDAVIIDVRTEEEISGHSLPGHVAINIANPTFTMKIDELDRDKSYFVYCRTGQRSLHACRYMMSQGFKKLYNLKGGIEAWEEVIDKV